MRTDDRRIQILSQRKCVSSLHPIQLFSVKNRFKSWLAKTTAMSRKSLVYLNKKQNGVNELNTIKGNGAKEECILKRDYLSSYN